MQLEETGLGSMELYHVGIAVHDIEEGKRRFGELLGITEWVQFDSEMPSIYRGEPVTAGAKAAYGRGGATYVELVEPTSGVWTARQFLDERGEGLYHLGYWVDDVPEAIRRAEERGIGLNWSVEAEGKPFLAYLEASQLFGVHIELVASSIRPIIEKRLA